MPLSLLQVRRKRTLKMNPDDSNSRRMEETEGRKKPDVRLRAVRAIKLSSRSRGLRADNRSSFHSDWPAWCPSPSHGARSVASLKSLLLYIWSSIWTSSNPSSSSFRWKFRFALSPYHWDGQAELDVGSLEGPKALTRFGTSAAVSLRNFTLRLSALKR